MADIRDLITQDQGWIKKIQSSLPGYKKYRNCEDLRAADSLLRQDLAAKLLLVEGEIKQCRNEIASSMDMDLLNIIGELVNLSHRTTEKVRNAEQGYSPWISGDVRIEEDELNRLYEFDLSLFGDIEKLSKEANDLLEACRSGSSDRRKMIVSTKDSFAKFEKLFISRIGKITEVAQR